MTKQCEKVMNNFLELDKNQKIPLHITAHLLFCKECRSKVRVLTLAEKSMQIILPPKYLSYLSVNGLYPASS